MLNSAQTPDNLNKSFIKVGDLQRQITAIRREDPGARPIDAANALLGWFQDPDNEAIRLDVLHYAISHMWSVVAAKMEDASGLFRRVEKNRAAKVKRKKATAKAVNDAMEQMVATLRHMTFKQARMLHGATAKLDLDRGSDDQRLGDVFSDDEIRSALG